MQRRFVAAQVDRFQKEQVVEVIAPWLINPETSKFYSFWNVVITFILTVELVSVPVVLVKPETQQQYKSLFQTFDFLWLANMLI